jgi:hypothetical protein
MGVFELLGFFHRTFIAYLDSIFAIAILVNGELSLALSMLFMVVIQFS